MPRRKAVAVVEPDKTSTEVQVPGTDAPIDLFDLSAQIVAELAAGLSSAADIRRNFGISEVQWEVLKASPAFRNMLQEAVSVWRGDLNASQRITKKAEIILEESLPVLDKLAHDVTLAPSVRIEAIKQMESITGRKQKEAGQAGGGSGFVLNINLSNGKQGVTIQGTPAKEMPSE